jgi:uncharacterized membrane protein
MTSEFDLRALDEEPPTPSRVDVERAIADGRRRRTRRGVGYAGAATLTVVAVVGASVAVSGLFTDTRPDADVPAASGQPAPTPPTSCTLEQLPVPDNEPMALTSGADPTGKYIVGRTYPEGGGYRGVIWQDGQATAVDLPGDEEESLADVNSAGTAVGWSYEGGGPVPYVYSGGQVSRLPGADHGSAFAINDAGAIVGEDAAGAALMWPSVTAEPVSLPLPEGASAATANDIDEDGTVVGNIDLERPYVWFADGTHRALPLPTIDGKPATNGRVFTVRNGWATGWASTGGGAEGGARAGADGLGEDAVAVRWNVNTDEVRVFTEFDVRANTANAQGWQIGTNTEGRAVLVTDAGTVPLPELAEHEPGGLTNIPSTLSDDGRLITGQSDDATDTIQAVVWRCE